MSEFKDREDVLARHRENRARMASSSMEFTSTGTGVVEFSDRMDFGMIFIEKPRVHYGCEVDADDLRELADLDDDDPLPLPQCTGAVTAWDTDEDDNYLGCWCAVSVTLPDGSPISTPTVIHHFDFQAIALKTVPTDPQD